MRHAVLELPELPLQAAGRVEPQLDRGWLGVLDGDGRRAGLAGVGPKALAAGVRPGMTAAQGQARAKALIVRHRARRAEEEARAALREAALGLAPRIEETAPGRCLADLAGRPEAVLERACARAVEALAELGWTARAGLGPTPQVALYAAALAAPVRAVRDPAPFLAALPLALAGPTPAQADLLARWGLKTCGDLLALPRADLARRLGPDGLALAERAAGLGARPLQSWQPPPQFHARTEFEGGLETLEPLLFVLRRQAGDLLAELAEARRAALEAHLTLVLDGGGAHPLALRLPEPTTRAEPLLRALETLLEGVRTAQPVVALHLELRPGEAQARQRGLFTAAVRDPAALSETLARLHGLVGAEHCGVPCAEASHRPDAFALGPLPEEVEAPPPPGEADTPWGPPLRRLRPPAAVRVACHPDGTPQWLDSPAARGPLAWVGGPYPLSGDWWDGPRAWDRREWDAALAAGGLVRLAEGGGQWTLEGFYG